VVHPSARQSLGKRPELKPEEGKEAGTEMEWQNDGHIKVVRKEERK
jgi:hypothetical protein